MDHTQIRILWIHNLKHFFTTDLKIVNTASGNLKQSYYIHQLFDKAAYHSAIYELESWIKVAPSLIQEH